MDRDFELFSQSYSPRRQDQEDLDSVSIAPGQQEKDALGLLSDKEDKEDSDSESHQSEVSVSGHPKKSDRFCQYLADKKSDDSINILKKKKNLFGDDIVSKSSDQIRLCLDKPQEDILAKSWRAMDPERLTAYKEDSKVYFPINEKSESTLQVPSLGDLLEPMLIKKHGQESMKAWGKSKQLASQPLRAIESIAYQGQMASRIGIISVCFIQQALGSFKIECSQRTLILTVGFSQSEIFSQCLQKP